MYKVNSNIKHTLHKINENASSIKNGISQLTKNTKMLVTTNTLLTNGSVFDSTILDMSNYNQIQTHVLASHDGSMAFIFHGNHGGTDIIRSLTIPYVASDGFKLFSAPCFSDFVQYKFTNNSGSDQTDFKFETKLLSNALSGQVLDLTSFISPSMTTMLTRSIIVAQNSKGTYSNVRSNQFDELQVAIKSPLSAFGNLRVSNLTPVVQYTFSYIINDRLWNTSASTGSATRSVSQSMAKVSTGTTTGSVSAMESIKRIKYRAGQGIVIRFTSIFTAGISDTMQYIGFGDSYDGLFVGFNGNQFGIMRRTKTSGSAVDSWTYSDSFIDPLDGSETLPVIDFTKGQVFQISLQYLGFGLITFSIENPNTGRFVRFHQIEYANANIVPSMALATLPCCIYADNNTTTSDIVVKSSSFAAFTEGKIISSGIKNAFSGDISATTTEKQIFSIRVKTIFGTHENHVQTFLKYLSASMSSSGNRNCTIRILLNPTLTTPSWADVSATSSQLEIDTSGTLTAGSGGRIFTTTLASNTSISTALNDVDLFIGTDDILTISCVMGSSTGDVSASLNVLEDL